MTDQHTSGPGGDDFRRDDRHGTVSDRHGTVGDRLEHGLERLEDRIESGLETVRDVIKPRLRGWLHLGTFPLCVVAGIVLVVLSPDTRSKVATGIFAVTASLLFGVSALYHRGTWGPRAFAVLQRLDHANIFLIIAGTYTPFCVLLLDDALARTVLWIVWGGAIAGVAFRVFWVGAPRWLYVPVYVALGWVAILYTPQLLEGAGTAVFVLIVVGGALYTVGGLVYGIKKPNPSRHWFGFHEVFHALTVAAFIAHYTGVSIAAYSRAA